MSLTGPATSNTELTQHCNCMEEVKHRVGLVRSVLTGAVSTGYPEFNSEIVFLQFRKILELIAFASLTANKDVYSAAYATFATHWNAQRMLRDLAKVNPDFYPLALESYTLEDGVKHFPRAADGFLTKEEFVMLYDICAKFLHAKNPFNTKDAVIQAGYNPEQWVSRIQKLLSIHTISLVSGNRWVIYIPSEGKIQGCAATPLDSENFKASSLASI